MTTTAKLVLCCSLLVSFPVRQAFAGDAPESSSPAAKPSANDSDRTNATKSTQPAAGRDENAILDELRTQRQKFDELMPSLSAIADPDARKEDGAALKPVLKKIVGLLGELAVLQTDDAERAGLESDQLQYLAILATLGDDDAQKSLAQAARGKGEQALAAKSALTLSGWWAAAKNAASQEKLLAEYAAVAKEHPDSERVILTLAVMAAVGPANNDLTLKIADILRKSMRGDAAKKLASELDPAGALRELLDKPLAVKGRLIDGATLSLADWKGKVVLVDCWATWCGPCNAEIPRIRELYEKYHTKGLELVGVDCDSDDDTVSEFVKDKKMPWPQLREQSQSEKQPWHPLATGWGVSGIPTMFLVDKKGVLRYIDAREDTAAKVEKLLAE